MSLPAYAEYKDSGVAWLGEVPGHWEVKRLKHCLALLTEKVESCQNKVALENIESWSGRFLPSDTEFEGDGIAFQKHDILFGKLRPYLAKAYLADSSGEAVGDFHVLRPRTGVVPRFAQYQILSRDFVALVDGSTFGSKMPRASWEFVGNMSFPLPESAEQTAIATFLVHETAKIDGLIAEQEKLIALLAEKRQATISHAVTKGLNPDAPMRDSGVAWLGEVPGHWIVCAMRRILVRVEQGWSPECYNREADEDEWAVLKAGCVNHGRFNQSDNKALPDEFQAKVNYEVCAGDLLMSRASGSPQLVGSVAYIHQTRTKLMLSDKIFRLNLSIDSNPQFVAWLYNSRELRTQIEQAISGAEGLANNLPQAGMKAFSIPLPPISEQAAIVCFLDLETARLDALTAAATRGIALLKERRSALISAAVTGKIDVRHLAEAA